MAHSGVIPRHANVSAVTHTYRMTEDPYEKLIRTDVSFFSSNWEEYDHLRPFTCSFEVSDSDDGTTDLMHWSLRSDSTKLDAYW